MYIVRMIDDASQVPDKITSKINTICETYKLILISTYTNKILGMDCLMGIFMEFPVAEKQPWT